MSLRPSQLQPAVAPKTSAPAITWSPPKTRAPAITWSPPKTSAPAITWSPPKTHAPVITWSPPKTFAPAITWSPPKTSPYVNDGLSVSSTESSPALRWCSSPVASPPTLAYKFAIVTIRCRILSGIKIGDPLQWHVCRVVSCRVVLCRVASPMFSAGERCFSLVGSTAWWK